MSAATYVNGQMYVDGVPVDNTSTPKGNWTSGEVTNSQQGGSVLGGMGNFSRPAVMPELTRPAPRPFTPIGNNSTFEAATVAQPNFNFDKLSDSITRFSDAIDKFSASQSQEANNMQPLNRRPQINPNAVGQAPPRPSLPYPNPSQPSGSAASPLFEAQTVMGTTGNPNTRPALDKGANTSANAPPDTDGNWQDWFGSFMEGLGLFGGTLGGGAAIKSAYDRLGAIGESAQQGALGIGQAGLDQTTFGGVTGESTTGSSANFDPSTGLTFDLSNKENAFMNNFLNMAKQRSEVTPYGYRNLVSGPDSYASQAGQLGSTFMTRAGQDTAAREGEVYDRIRALQRDEEKAQRLALEERLASQGRLGVGTAQFGGTPEQLAMQKAQANAQNQAAVQAMQQAQAEQLQQAQLGQAYTMMSPQLYQSGQGLLAGQGDLAQQAMGLAYLPQAQQMNLMNQALQGAGMTQQGQLYGAGLFGEAAMGGLEALLGSGLGQANLMGTLGTSLMSGAAQQGGWGDIDWGSIL